MNSVRMLSLMALVGATGLGCVVRAQGEAYAPVHYTSRPTLVAVGPGVWVVRGASRATYFVADSYWAYGDGAWYRSSNYGGGWVVVQASAVPTTIVSIHHETYVNFLGEPTAATMLAPNAVVVVNDPPPKKEAEGLPGLGNKAKAAGEQPGEVGKGLTKDEPMVSSPPGASSPKAEKKDDKKKKK